jgi:hypothetical protein
MANKAGVVNSYTFYSVQSEAPAPIPSHFSSNFPAFGQNLASNWVVDNIFFCDIISLVDVARYPPLCVPASCGGFFLDFKA